MRCYSECISCHVSITNRTPCFCVKRKGELEEIISCMSNIESHIWFLSEQYVTLMESYKKMRGNIDSLQSSSLNNVVINSCEKERLKNALSPRHRTETASDACRSLLQITSGNPNDKVRLNLTPFMSNTHSNIFLLNRTLGTSLRCITAVTSLIHAYHSPSHLES